MNGYPAMRISVPSSDDVESVASTRTDDRRIEHGLESRKNARKVELSVDSREVTQAERGHRTYVDVRVIEHRQAAVLNPAPVWVVERKCEKRFDTDSALCASQFRFGVGARQGFGVLKSSREASM
jgi:hypothetical protein